MKKHYTYDYVITVSGKITVTSEDDEAAEQEATAKLESGDIASVATIENIIVDVLSFKDAEPVGPDRTEE